MLLTESFLYLAAEPRGRGNRGGGPCAGSCRGGRGRWRPGTRPSGRALSQRRRLPLPAISLSLCRVGPTFPLHVSTSAPPVLTAVSPPPGRNAFQKPWRSLDPTSGARSERRGVFQRCCPCLSWPHCAAARWSRDTGHPAPTLRGEVRLSSSGPQGRSRSQVPLRAGATDCHGRSPCPAAHSSGAARSEPRALGPPRSAPLSPFPVHCPPSPCVR